MGLSNRLPLRKSVKARSRPSKPIALGPFVLGLNTVQGANALEPNELSACLNFRINEMGDLETRPGLSLYTNTALDNQPYSIINYPLSQDVVPFYIFEDGDYIWTNTPELANELVSPPTAEHAHTAESASVTIGIQGIHPSNASHSQSADEAGASTS